MSTSTIPIPRLQHIQLQGVKSFLILYSRKRVPSLTAYHILTNKTHPFHLKLRRTYQEKDPNSLWWTVYGVKSQIPTGVVRGWGERRLKQAFRLALRDKGFDAEGRILGEQPPSQKIDVEEEGGGEEGDRMMKRPEKPLTGTVRLQVMKPIITLSGLAVRKQAQLAVDKIVELCAESSSSSSNNVRKRRMK